MTGKSMKEAILEAAEKRGRHAGYSNMSFRDVAKDVGIKSASVHYHFPTKSDLGTALVERYKDHFSQKLLQIDTTNFSDALAKFVQLYDAALVMDQSICLCAALGAESMGIKKQIRAETGVFFQVNIEWFHEGFNKWRTVCDLRNYYDLDNPVEITQDASRICQEINRDVR